MWEEFEETKKYAFNLRNNTMHQSFMRDFPNNVYLLLPLIHFDTWQRLSTPTEKFLIIFFSFYFNFSLIPTPIWRVCVCVLYLFSVSRYELCVCVGTCVRVCVWAQIWSRHQPWEILRCDWAPTSNRFYLI